MTREESRVWGRARFIGKEEEVRTEKGEKIQERGSYMSDQIFWTNEPSAGEELPLPLTRRNGGDGGCGIGLVELYVVKLPKKKKCCD